MWSRTFRDPSRAMMAEIDEARAKVSAHLRSDDFELWEFLQGWRVIRPIPKDMMGTPTLAVERSSGNLLLRVAVPPERVSEEFEQVRRHARVIEDVPRPDTSDDG